MAIVTVDRRMNANFLCSAALRQHKCGWHIDHEKWCVVKPNFKEPNTMDHQARKFKKMILTLKYITYNHPFHSFCKWLSVMMTYFSTPSSSSSFHIWRIPTGYEVNGPEIYSFFSSYRLRWKRTPHILSVKMGLDGSWLKILIYPAGNSSYERFVYIIQRTHRFNMRSN